MTTGGDDDEVGICPICQAGPVRLVIVAGDGWLMGRFWKLCFGCLSKVHTNLHAAPWDRRHPLELTRGERDVCAMLGIDPRDAQTQGWLLARPPH